MQPAQRAIGLPPAKVVKDRTARRELWGKRSPLAARTQDIQEPIEDFPNIHCPLAPAAAGRGNQRSHLGPLLVRGVAGIPQVIAVIASAILLRPHTQCLRVAPLTSQLPSFIQELLKQTLRLDYSSQCFKAALKLRVGYVVLIGREATVAQDIRFLCLKSAFGVSF
jgi:hypothetical protein